jgi:hypothetical protein
MVNCDASVCVRERGREVRIYRIFYHVMSTSESLNFVMVNSVFFTDDKLTYALVCNFLCNECVTVKVNSCLLGKVFCSPIYSL